MGHNIEISNTITKIIQASLIGKLNIKSEYKPNVVAKSILDKIDFDQLYANNINKDVNELILFIWDYLNDEQNSLDNQLNNLGDDEKLLANFIRGRKTSNDFMLKLLSDFKEKTQTK